MKALAAKLPVILGVSGGVAFAVGVGGWVLFPAVANLQGTTIAILTGVVGVSWVAWRWWDGEGESRVLSEPLQVKRVDRRFARELTRCLLVEIGKKPADVISVCAGFDTDYSSIPAPCRGIVHWSKVDVAGVVHDYLYRYPKNRTRAEDDWIWWVLARSGKWRADPVQAALCWLALRGFGWTSRPEARQFNPFWYLVVLLNRDFGGRVVQQTDLVHCRDRRGLRSIANQGSSSGSRARRTEPQVLNDTQNGRRMPGHRRKSMGERGRGRAAGKPDQVPGRGQGAAQRLS